MSHRSRPDRRRPAVPRGVAADVSAALAVKIVSMPLTAGLGLAALHVLSTNYGAPGRALYGLVIVIPVLVPFADLGLGGALVEIVASRTQLGKTQVLRHFRSSLILLLSVGAALLCINVSLAFLSLWPSAIGLNQADANDAVALAVGIFALCIPLSLGYRILLGFGLNWLMVLLQVAAGLIGLTWVLTVGSLRGPLWLVTCGPQLATLVASGIASILAVRLLRKDRTPPVGDLKFDLWRLAGANLAIGVSLPLTYQSGRLILAHTSSVSEVAAYTAAFALYGPLNSLLITGGQSLWPRLSASRTADFELNRRVFRRGIAIFSLVGLVSGFGLATLGKPVSDSIVHNVSTSFALFLSFALLILVAAVNLPFGMAMMGPGSVQFQAVCYLVAAIVSVGACLFLAPVLGAAGAALAPAIGIGLCVAAPSALRLRRVYFRNLEAAT